MKPIRIENGIVIYYGNLAGRIRNGQAVVDPMFQVPELKEFLEKQRSVNEIKWQDGIFDQLASGQGETREIQSLKNCRVWQLKPEVDICKKFIGYDALIQNSGCSIRRTTGWCLTVQWTPIIWKRSIPNLTWTIRPAMPGIPSP